MSGYDHWISNMVQVVEGVGAGILIIGGIVVFARFCVAAVFFRSRRSASYRELRQDLGRVISVGLEVLIVADIIRTIIVEPTLVSVAVLGAIVLIRILLTWALEVEIEGTWPWKRRSAESMTRSQESD